jgi:hypothetical protein
MASHGIPSVITLLSTANPKHGESAKRFALYRDGMTIEDLLIAYEDFGETKRKAWLDLAWDLHHNFIALEAKPNAVKEEEKKEEKKAA